MPGLLPDVDPEGLLEFSVVYTDRALNHMSRRFVGAMQDIVSTLKEVYQAHAVAIVPGSGTFGMESVARQFANGERVLIVRNGWFSYRWTQILEMGRISADAQVCRAERQGSGAQDPWAPMPAAQVAAAIRAQRPRVVFAPHVETASGIVLPDDYLRTLAAAAREVDALFVLDCVASGALWVDMRALGVDVLISAPQKGWSSVPCCAMVMLSERARARLDDTTSTSFACDLKKWTQIAEGYAAGRAAYHATMPTAGLVRLQAAMAETRAAGFERVRAAQIALGTQVRALLESRGFPSVAAAGFKASGVVVSYTGDAGIRDASKFAAAGLQTATGVPLECGEGADFSTFRMGLFGLDKWLNVERTVGHIAAALEQVAPAR